MFAADKSYAKTKSEKSLSVFFSVAVMGLMSFCTAASAQDAKTGISAELAARMAAEKEARKACKIEICKAFATPGTGPITCDVTKTWAKEEILSRVVGGSYVWGYGHMQCKLALNLDKADLGKALTEAATKIAFPEHKLICNVDDADTAKGQAFGVTIAVTPVVAFEGGEAKSVDLQNVKSEGSSVASAAVTSVMAVEKVSGIVSRAAVSEINTFVYNKCAADGVAISKK